VWQRSRSKGEGGGRRNETRGGRLCSRERKKESVLSARRRLSSESEYGEKGKQRGRGRDMLQNVSRRRAREGRNQNDQDRWSRQRTRGGGREAGQRERQGWRNPQTVFFLLCENKGGEVLACRQSIYHEANSGDEGAR
jgi:hypothetical protein